MKRWVEIFEVVTKLTFQDFVSPIKRLLVDSDGGRVELFLKHPDE